MWHESTGTIIYDPHRPGLNTKNRWWCILTVDKEITRYYRYWIQRELRVKGLCQPSWDAHISILRGEKPEPELMELWKKYHREKVTYRYKHFPRQSGDTTGFDRPNHHWFIEVDCPRLMELRKELNRPTDWKLHITVGRTWY